MTNLIKYTETVIEKYPQLNSHIQDLLQLCNDEIEEGGSEENEITLCWNDIEYLVKEEDSKILSRILKIRSA